MEAPVQSQPFLGLLRSAFGFSSFRPGQAEAIASLASGENAVVVMPTGAGKSLIYQFHAVGRPGVALVISPLISLMQDQVASLTRRGIPATFINSSIPAIEQERRIESMVAGDYRLVYVAPERLRSTAFRQALSKARISLLAIDEAHCISQWGHDFRPDYLHIAEARRSMGSPLTAALTATATPRVRSDVASLLGLDPVKHIVTGFNRANLTFEVSYARDAAGKMRALLAMLGKLDGGASIVYAGTRRDSEELAEFISSTAGVRARYYHAGMGADERARAQDEFMSGRLRVVVATNAFGMGIDRQDVRLVAHYSIPGSLEEYYQEAGRAGRDGEPARAVLLYSPPDRALQEFFIDSSEMKIDDLRELYVRLSREASQPRWFTAEDISLVTGMHEVTVRVALAQLEEAEAVAISAMEGPRMLVGVGEWSAGAVREVVQRSKAHLAHKREQLDQMVRYAETNECRRRIILDHFGDAGAAESERCCDNCMVKGTMGPKGQMGPMVTTEVSDLTRENKTALLILDSVRRMPREIGVGKLARILCGSKSRGVTEFEYDKMRCYGKLSVFTVDETTQLIEQMVSWGYLKTVGGRLPVLRLTNKGVAALESRERIALVFPRQIVIQQVDRAQRKKRQIGDTVELTASMFASGMSPDKIAAERGLTESTICSHFAKLIESGRVELARVIANDTVELVRGAIRKVGDTSRLAPIKVLLPEAITYGEIACVVAAETPPQSPPEKGGGVIDPPQSPLRKGGGDAVEQFLSRPHPKPLAGPWKAGWSLGFHSSFAGSEWARSGVGELAFRLKYRSDQSALEPLVEQAMDACREHPELVQVDAVAPVPPSMARDWEPVRLVAKALAAKVGLPVEPLVSKVRQTQPQKEMRTLAQKRANVAGAFRADGNVRGRKVLVIDDLYDSGATLEEVTRTLRGAGASSVCVLTLTRTIHSDA